jgi:hypothetical protein
VESDDWYAQFGSAWVSYYESGNYLGYGCKFHSGHSIPELLDYLEKELAQ